MNLSAVGLLVGSLLALSACGRAPVDERRPPHPQPSVEAESDAVALASRVVRDERLRRARLEESLVNQANGYSQTRLAQYHPGR